MILSVSQRSNSDDRIVGVLFRIIAAEVAEISYNHSLCLIFQALLETVQEFFHVSDEQMDAFVFCFIGKLPKQLQQSLCIELDAACCA